MHFQGKLLFHFESKRVEFCSLFYPVRVNCHFEGERKRKSQKFCPYCKNDRKNTVKILKLWTPKIITVIVLKLEQLGCTIEECIQMIQLDLQTVKTLDQTAPEGAV